jgi:ComF family protein
MSKYIEAMPLAFRLLRLPSHCALCHDWGWSRLCAACVASQGPPRHRCARCAVALPSSIPVCGACVVNPPPQDATLAALDYAAPWDSLVARYKFHDALDLGDALAACLLSAHAEAGRPEPGLLLPVPLSAERLQQRGYNQAWELTRRLATRLRAPATASLLIRVRHTDQQMALPLSERVANVHNAFAIEPRHRAELQGRCVTVVDDVMTTGATVGEVARVLKAAGAARVQVWALSRTPAPKD